LRSSAGSDLERIRQLLLAVLLIGSESELPIVLRNIAQAAIEVIDARSGGLSLVAGEGEAQVMSVGLPSDQIDAIADQPPGRGVLGTQSYLVVPVRGPEGLLGHLYLAEPRGATEFSDHDAGVAEGFAVAAAIAIEYAELRLRLLDLTLVEDRERVAVDLHDTVTQRLFAISLSLQGTVKAIASPEAARRVATAVEDLDQTIQQVRATIFTAYVPPLSGRSDHL
jgi:signal transduction histidine kinase